MFKGNSDRNAVEEMQQAEESGRFVYAAPISAEDDEEEEDDKDDGFTDASASSPEKVWKHTRLP